MLRRDLIYGVGGMVRAGFPGILSAIDQLLVLLHLA